MVSPMAEEMAILIRLKLVQFFVNKGETGPAAEYLGNELGRLIELDLVNNLGGVRFTIPTLKNLERRDKHRQIRKKFTGANVKQLAFEFGYARSTVYSILRKPEQGRLEF